ncbi:MAG: cbb3-type cytochrome c oxidase subunit I, partial [Proteobacteria bacterium]|nr:cbb3-type cytochrome c oxidase subunit I [Pseudomonadota bacterium]
MTDRATDGIFGIDRSSRDAAHSERGYLEETSIRSWLLSVDHKRIGILYAVSTTFFFFIGGLAATLMRLELISPNGHFFTNGEYNRLFTMHGVIMVWFFLVPVVPSTLGNFLLPLMIGARDVAFPRLNLISWYLNLAGGALALFALVAGGVDTGWTFYEPYSGHFSNSFVALACAGVFVAGFGTIATGLNFIVTIHTLRTRGMTWFRLPLFVWSLYATSIIFLLATPVLAMTLLLIFSERVFGLAFFDPNKG